MNRRRGFTLIELLVVIAIIALLMAILMPALTQVRKQAKAAACQMNLRQWGVCFSMYTDDNDSSFPPGNISAGTPRWSWIYALHPYYRDGMLRLCPMATKPWGGQGDTDGNKESPYVAFGPIWGTSPQHYKAFKYDTSACGEYCDPDPQATNGASWPIDFPYTEGDNYVSYGQNDWVRNDPRSSAKWDQGWRTSTIKGAGNVPLMVDCKQHYVFLPDNGDDPPSYAGEPGTYKDGGATRMVCIDRHNGAINGVFLDWSSKRIGLKELWKLKWHRAFDINAGPVEGQEPPAGWPKWMRKFKKYE